jgi:hypothetical protein
VMDETNSEYKIFLRKISFKTEKEMEECILMYLMEIGLEIIDSLELYPMAKFGIHGIGSSKFFYHSVNSAHLERKTGILCRGYVARPSV